jgi:hypothetical protein
MPPLSIVIMPNSLGISRAYTGGSVGVCENGKRLASFFDTLNAQGGRVFASGSPRFTARRSATENISNEMQPFRFRLYVRGMFSFPTGRTSASEKNYWQLMTTSRCPPVSPIRWVSYFAGHCSANR